jgi:hypothetical protein
VSATEDAPGRLYVGTVMHARLRPRRHRFTYRVFTLLVDLDRLAELDRRHRLLSVDRANLLAFWQRDHGPRDGSPLRPWVEARLAEQGLAAAGHRIQLLAMPRLFGYVFNPLSVYYCHDRAGRLAAIVYEVKNTFGEQHAYTLPVEAVAAASGWLQQRCAKAFYVSPFIEPDARYRFRMLPPADRLAVVIQETLADVPLLVATLHGQARALTDRNLLLAALRWPFMTHKVMAAIHWEALWLWLKRIPLQPRLALDLIGGKQRSV